MGIAACEKPDGNFECGLLYAMPSGRRRRLDSACSFSTTGLACGNGHIVKRGCQRQRAHLRACEHTFGKKQIQMAVALIKRIATAPETSAASYVLDAHINAATYVLGAHSVKNTTFVSGASWTRAHTPTAYASQPDPLPMSFIRERLV